MGICKRILFASTIVTLLCAHGANAQTIDDYDARLAQLESSVHKLSHWQRRSFAQANSDASIYAGYSFVFAKLHYHESFRAMVTDFATSTQNLLPFENSFELTPRMWVGAKACNGLGVRLTYWNYDHNDGGLTLVNDGIRIPGATSASVIFPALIVAGAPGDTLSVNTSLDATTLDLEGTYDLRIRRMELTVGAGLRYASAEQTYAAAVTGILPASLNWVRDSEAFGPSISAIGRLPIGDAGFYGTGGLRVGFLFGEKTLARTVVNDATPAPNTGPPNLILNDAEENMGVYAVSIGAGWRKQTRTCELFAEGGYEGQLWTAGGAPTLTFLGFSGLSVSLGVAL